MAVNMKLFNLTLAYKGSFPAAQLQADLQQIAAQDKQIRYSSPFIVVAAAFLGILLLAVLTFTTLILLGESASFIILLVSTVLLCLLCNRWVQLTKLPNLRYLLPMRLIETLSCDMEQPEPFDVRIDFSKPTATRKRTGKEPWPGKINGTKTFFEDPWMRLSSRFIDNTLFVLTLTEMTMQWYGGRRSRDKTKYTRETTKRGMVAQLSLTLPSEKYGSIFISQSELEDALRLPEGIALEAFEVNNNQLLLQAKVPPNALDAEGLHQLFSQMLLGAYQVLNRPQPFLQPSI